MDPRNEAAAPPTAAFPISKPEQRRMSLLDFYVKRAAEARDAAEASPLANVRDRCLRAAEAWDSMAARAARTERHRVEEAERKASLPAPLFVRGRQPR